MRKKIKFINLQIFIWYLQVTYLDSTNEEGTRMFKEHHSKLVNKFYGKGKFFVYFFWIVWQIFWSVSQYLI